ncbi:MAG TPA: TetR family transcriptional regulator [Polyangiaceae bacterium]|jgi:TetR/AcrR family transcriptional repressor of nem operon|nr:TetR family transcriptional regulator [Polyangiaceae bacterium]
MRYPEGHNEEVRARIVDAASRAMRREGLDAVSIPKIMKAAGLTHGAFYGHFKDRDDLVAAAILHAASESAFSEEATAEGAFAKYLSTDHLHHPEFGCVIAALAFDGARQQGRVRRTFAEVARRFLRRVNAKIHPKIKSDRVSDDALARASQVVGAVVLARLVEDEELAERILAVARGRADR